ncbi:LacI family DNA-binding transcriptional regulator [Dactylosporangium siamense]|uniref:LacI family transcriptional regulator n=1 Tax=Dactylosporangium siamense TaxID=685454 RepID=A0A919PPX7_9ACTN|nr:LacI family DNA-binding transcriptional regulator [Dactylosporangium siamense]GIG47984.1 LacI family transcriptional regulator [Dactylosporangium siamense]
MRSSGRPTLQDVATLAGVSIGTASSVFSRRQPVAARTREAVLGAAAQLGYRPRPRFGAPDVPGLQTVGLLARPIHYPGPTNPYYSVVLQGAQRAAADLGLTMTYEALPVDGAGAALPLVVRRRAAQGLLILGWVHPRLLERIVATGIPCVLVDHTAEGLPVDSVRADDARGAALATKHMIRLGHRDPPPALITGPTDLLPIADRYAGYRAALHASGVTLDPRYVRRAPDAEPYGGRLAMHQLLDLPRPPTAVFCWSDTAAIGALQSMRERQIAVPRQCSVFGFDDIDLAGHTSPALTTVRVDKRLLGAQGIWHLVQRIREPQLPPRLTYVDVQLALRESVAPPPARG